MLVLVHIFKPPALAMSQDTGTESLPTPARMYLGT